LLWSFCERMTNVESFKLRNFLRATLIPEEVFNLTEAKHWVFFKLFLL